MPRVKKNSNETVRPALTKGARENQMIALAENLAEQRILDGTASNALILHYLKLASEKERLEREKLEEENKLLRAKTEVLKSSKDTSDVYIRAYNAMREYTGED